jgi:hypothetical protein
MQNFMPIFNTVEKVSESSLKKLQPPQKIGKTVLRVERPHITSSFLLITFWDIFKTYSIVLKSTSNCTFHMPIEVFIRNILWAYFHLFANLKCQKWLKNKKCIL